MLPREWGLQIIEHPRLLQKHGVAILQVVRR